MPIIVRLFANFREVVGKDRIEVAGVANVASLLEKLVEIYGEKLARELYLPGSREPKETVHILVNNKVMSLHKGLSVPLKDGDVIAIFPPVAGGGLLRKELGWYGRQIIIQGFARRNHARY
jgi:molybdopterin synthase sulfur carrier subunit